MHSNITNFFFFFFSSRRRHTRLQGDWSSDVCSSDLPEGAGLARALRVRQARHRHVERVGVGEKNPLRGAHRALGGRRGRVVLEDLGDDLTTLGEAVQREPEDLVIRTTQHATVTVGLGRLAPLGFPHEAELVHLMDGKAEHGVALLHDERVTPEPDQMKLPEDPAVVEGHLPAVVLLRRHRRGPEQNDPGDPESSHCPSTFAAFAASAAFFFSFFFLRRVTPYVPRKILPRLLRMSPLPMSRQSSVVSHFMPPSFSSRLNCSVDTGMTDSRPIRTSARSAKARSFLISASGTGRGSLSTARRSTTANLGSFCLRSGYASDVTSAMPTTAFSS